MPWNISITQLSSKKASLSHPELRRHAQRAENAAPQQGVEIYYTDGSVDPTTGRAAAAFVHPTSIGHFRLPDGSSTLQAELVGLLKALEDAASTQNRQHCHPHRLTQRPQDTRTTTPDRQHHHNN
ncbi:hypothetical protein GWK47_048770 [Chionoecetes opilio]|uniref:Uncharacterized protein n=1 Tax=Chionoecetes opilio TaxID=41210 RepID=A0A8J4YCG3_CHIOP|nr:hypothetical protein GWK47_048770 [Chionoecetes opilio]